MKTVDTIKIDQLGTLLAQITKLTEDANKIKEELREIASLPDGQHEFIGTQFRAYVKESDTKTLDYKKLIADLEIAQEIVKKYTKVTAKFSVCVDKLEG